jgi:large subunit ribosomal protein L21
MSTFDTKLRLCYTPQVLEADFRMYAIIETGGKQYRVEPDEVFSVEKLDVAKGDVVEFDKVALIQDEGKVLVGKPWVEGAKVVCRVLKAEGKDRKVVIFTYKAKDNVKRRKGHRQRFTQVKVEQIAVAGTEN